MAKVTQNACTYWATIYVGLRERHSGAIHNLETVQAICQEYVNDVGLCVTVTATTYIYTNGREPGAAIGLINYPRFPSSAKAIEKDALELAARLQRALGQLRVSVVFPNETVMLSGPTTENERNRQ